MKFKDLQNILQNLKTDERITQEKIGHALGVKKAAISSRCKSDSDVRPDEIAKIEKYFNVSLTDRPEWLYDSRGKLEKSFDNFISKFRFPISDEDFMSYMDFKESDELEAFMRKCEDIIDIERIEGIRPECGAGMELFTEPNVEPFRISRQSIKTYLRCTAPENLKTFQASGDSMEGIISHGDWLLVDVGCKDASYSGIYIFTANGKYRCKRLNITLDGRLEVKSDNPNYATEYVGPDSNVEIEIVGRVLNNLSRGI